MRTWLDALLTLLRRMLGRMGTPMDQSGAGTQIGQVRGNVYVVQATAEQQERGSATPAAAQRPAPELSRLMDMYKRQLTAAERSGTDSFMRRTFGTTTIRNLSEGDRVRLWAYMQTCLRNRTHKRRVKRAL